MTIPNSDVSITLDEVSQKNKDGPPFTCDWDPCNYKSKERPMLMKHIDEHLGKTEKEILIDESPDPIKVEELQTKDASCDKTVLKEDEGEVTTVEPSEPEVDASSLKRVDINCDECSFTAPSSNNIENHIKKQHGLQELLSCNQCDFV